MFGMRWLTCRCRRVHTPTTTPLARGQGATSVAPSTVGGCACNRTDACNDNHGPQSSSATHVRMGQHSSPHTAAALAAGRQGQQGTASPTRGGTRHTLHDTPPHLSCQAHETGGAAWVLSRWPKPCSTGVQHAQPNTPEPRCNTSHQHTRKSNERGRDSASSVAHYFPNPMHCENVAATPPTTPNLGLATPHVAPGRAEVRHAPAPASLLERASGTKPSLPPHASGGC